MDALFILVRQLAKRSTVTEVAAPKWLVQRHGLASMAARAGAASYRDDLARATLEWARTERALPPIIAALRHAGVRVAPIKGAAYAKSLYAAPAERPMADVDLLVPPGQLDQAERVLANLGFAAGPTAVMHHAHAWVKDDFAIDLHRSIIAPGRSRLDLDAVWSRTTPGWPDGAEWLEPSDALVFHLVHLARNRLRLPLVNLVDAARLRERADVGVALARAGSWGLGPATTLAMNFCDAILDGRTKRAGGWLGPSRAELVSLTQPTFARKAMFDIATAGSAKQIVARVMGYGANLLARSRNG